MTYSLLDAHEFQSEDLHNCPTHGKFCFANLGQHIRIAHALSSEHVSCTLDDSGLVSRTEHARTRHPANQHRISVLRPWNCYHRGCMCERFKIQWDPQSHFWKQPQQMFATLKWWLCSGVENTQNYLYPYMRNNESQLKWFLPHPLYWTLLGLEQW